MSDDLPVIDDVLVGRLIAAQFPQWAGLPLKRLEPAGSDNVIYRLGEEFSVRLPRGDWSAQQAEKESRWLPRLAPHLPVSIPVQLALGTPDFGYPWYWSVSRWLDGQAATVDGLADPERTASELAAFLTALQGITPGDLPESGDTLAGRDSATREAIAAVEGVFDTDAMTTVWDAALAAPAWDRAPVWCHGDMHNGNLLTIDGHLNAVIDFGDLGVGDPARDLVIAWTLMSGATRAVFRAALDVDAATWARGRGWALATGLNAYNSYAATRPDIAANTRRQIAAALADGAESP